MSSCTPENICRLITCPVTDDIPNYVGQFSLQNGLVFTNTLIAVPSTLYPGGTYYQPPGTITIPVPPNAGDPTLGKPTLISYQGCLSTVSATIPPGSTPAQMQAIINILMQEIAAQAAICNAPPSNPPPDTTVFWNTSQTASCPSGKSVKQEGNLPPNVSASTTGVTVAAGIFSSTVSQADADLTALNFAESFIGTAVLCGYYNTQQSYTCPNGTVQTIAAGLFFSTISQADADQQAIDQGNRQCGGLGGFAVWNRTQFQQNNAGVATATPDMSEGNSGFVTADCPENTSGFNNAAAAVGTTYTNNCTHPIGYEVQTNATAQNGGGTTSISVTANGIVVYSSGSNVSSNTASGTLGVGAQLVVSIGVAVDGVTAHNTLGATAVITLDLSC